MSAKAFLEATGAGLDNFKFLFKSSTTWTIIRNTILYNVTFIILGTVISIAAAILLNEVRNRTASKFYQSIILLPYLMSWVVVSYLVYTLLAADTVLVNSVLKSLGMKSINWYQEQKYWPFILTFCNIWKGTATP